MTSTSRSTVAPTRIREADATRRTHHVVNSSARLVTNGPDSGSRKPGTVAGRELARERENDPLAIWKNAAVGERRRGTRVRYRPPEYWAKEKVQAGAMTAKNGFSRDRRTTPSAGQNRTKSVVDISDRDGDRLSVNQRKRPPPQNEVPLDSDRTRQSKRPRAETHDESVQEGTLLKDTRLELLLEQWIWGDMRFTDVPIPNLCFYVRVCTRTSRLELLEKFGESTKVLKTLCFAHLRNYDLQVSFKHLGGDQSEAYVHLKPMNGVIDSITLKLSKDYDSLLTTIRNALRELETRGSST